MKEERVGVCGGRGGRVVLSREPTKGRGAIQARLEGTEAGEVPNRAAHILAHNATKVVESYRGNEGADGGRKDEIPGPSAAGVCESNAPLFKNFLQAKPRESRTNNMQCDVQSSAAYRRQGDTFGGGVFRSD